MTTLTDVMKGQLDNFAKDLMLKVSIKDLVALLDQKANL
jgi:hypothetical protein